MLRILFKKFEFLQILKIHEKMQIRKICFSYFIEEKMLKESATIKSLKRRWA